MDQPGLDGRVAVKAILAVESLVGSGVDLEVVVDKLISESRFPSCILSFLLTHIPHPRYSFLFFSFFSFLFLGYLFAVIQAVQRFLFTHIPLLSFPRYRRLDEMAGLPLTIVCRLYIFPRLACR